VSLVINTQIASWLATGSVSWLYYADRLMEFPSALLGVAIGTVMLPSLAKHHQNADPAEYSKLLDWGLRLTLLLAAPAALGLAMLSVPLIATLFWHGEFLRHDVLMTRAALVAYSFGLAGIVAVKILAPGFYARQDIRTPVKVGVATLAITQLANAALVPWLAHAGLAAAISIGATFNAGCLWLLLTRSGAYRPEANWGAFLLKVVVALYMMGGVLWFTMGSQASWFEIPTAARATKLLAIIAAGAGTYLAAIRIMGIRLRDFAHRG
jgi:putative peptidoglycan lipid II flippase